MSDNVRNIGDALLGSVVGALSLFFSAIPKIVGFLVILIIGWLIASAIARGVAALLRAIHFDGFAERAGVSNFVRRMDAGTDASGVLALIVKWFVRLIVLMVAFDALNLPAVSDILRQFLLWIPNLVVALVVLVIGGIVASSAAGVVRATTAEAGISNPSRLATIAKVAVWALTIVIAINQVGIAATLVNTLFTAVVGAAALALGLSFGLGGRDTARQIVDRWYRRRQEAEPIIERAQSTVVGGPHEPPSGIKH